MGKAGLAADHGVSRGPLGRADGQIEYGKPVSYGIRRCQFDHYALAPKLQLGEPCDP